VHPSTSTPFSKIVRIGEMYLAFFTMQTPGCRRRTSGASSRNAPPKPSSAAPSSMPRSPRTRPEPSPATTTFHEQFPPRGHEPPAWLYPVPYGCAALYTFFHLFQPPRGSATQRKPTTPHPQRTRPCTRLGRANTQGTHLFFTF